MTNKNLDNLFKTGQLKSEPFEKSEAMRMLQTAHRRLIDSGITEMSLEGQFTSAYNAAHAAALAALRWHGYRSENELIAFHCLGETLCWPRNRYQAFDAAHQMRNLVEYEGYLEIEESTVDMLRDLTTSLIKDVELLVNTP